MRGTLQFKSKGFKEAQGKLDFLKLSRKKKRWAHQMLKRKAKSFMKKRLGMQVDLNGKTFVPRKQGKGKMLMGSTHWKYAKDKDGNKTYLKNGKARRKTLGIRQNLHSKADAIEGTVFSPGKKVARFQNDGGSERWDADKAEKIYGRDKYKSPATKIQAKRLLHLGFKKKFKKGKRTVNKKPSQAWIIDNMTMGQAGLIISLLKGVKKKKSWLIKTPARSFMGVTDQEADKLGQYALELIFKYSS